MNIYPINDTLKKGLAVTYNPRNNPCLVESIGAFPYENVLQALHAFSCVDTSSLGTLAFPYPQLFVLSDVIIVCTETEIFELISGSLVSQISGLTAGATWDCLDFKTYIYLTNGQVAVTKNPETEVYAIDTTVPFGLCVCNFNGQVLIGSPNVPYS